MIDQTRWPFRRTQPRDHAHAQRCAFMNAPLGWEPNRTAPFLDERSLFGGGALTRSSARVRGREGVGSWGRWFPQFSAVAALHRLRSQFKTQQEIPRRDSSTGLRRPRPGLAETPGDFTLIVPRRLS